MALIDELKEMREAAQKRERERRFEAFELQTWADVDAKNVRDFDIAIAALTPFPTDAELDQVDLAIAIAREAEAIPDEPELFDDEPAEETYSILTGDPCIEPESGLHGEPIEEAPALNEQMQDEREQPVEDGYAPVTSPEADFWARTLTEQPKPQSYSPFNIFRREKEEA
jgi:hypothetical protein